MSIVALCSHVPDPRLNKRIRTLLKISSDLSVIYWEREHGYSFESENSNRFSYIKLESSNDRRFIKRLTDTKRLNEKSLSILKTINPNLLYVAGIECMPTARKLKKTIRCHVVLEIADLPARSYIEKAGPLSGFLENLVDREISSADSFVLTSPYYYDYYKLKIHFNKENVFVFENVPEKIVFDGFRRYSHNIFRVAFIGGVRYFDSIRALFEAAKGIENLEVVIAGKGPDYERVLELSRMYSNVRITGKYSYREEISNLYSDVDLVYAVYNTKGIGERLALPNKLYEAIVCGIPIVVSKGTCLERYVKELGVGFSVSDGNVEELRTLLLEIMGNGYGELQKISKKASEIKENYFYESIEKKFIEWISARTISKARGG